MKCEQCGADMDEDVGGLGCGDGVLRSPLRKCQKCEESAGAGAVWGVIPDFPVWGEAAKKVGGEVSTGSAGEVGAKRLRRVSQPSGESELAVAGAGCGEGVESESGLGWREFTPKEVNWSRCMARTWCGGQGGQCGFVPVGSGRYCKAHGAKEGKSTWLGAVDGPIPERKLVEFMKARKKRHGEKAESKGGALQRLRRAGLMRMAEEGVGESLMMEGRSAGAEVAERSAQEGVEEKVARRGVAAAQAASAAVARRVVEAERGRAGFAIEGAGGVVGGTTGKALGGEVDSGRGAGGVAAGSGVAARSRGRGRVVSGFGKERVEDVRALEERREVEACDRQKQRREEGARGRMVDFEGRELDRSEGGAFSLKKRG